LSNRNSVNKKEMFSKTDKALTKSFLGFWENINSKVSINGHTYNLLEGVVDD